MIRYLIVLLDESSPSICHYSNYGVKSGLIPIDVLKKGILFGMKENLMINFIYPRNGLSDEYLEAIESIDHINICPDDSPYNADVVVLNDWHNSHIEFKRNCIYLLRTTFEGFSDNYLRIPTILRQVAKLNIVITDIHLLKEAQLKKYDAIIQDLVPKIASLFTPDNKPHLNILTDRLYLTRPNHCNAGVESITLAPDGCFYICPAYYHSGKEPVGDIHRGLVIKNQQLYKLDHSPICRLCDAYQCKRCVWLNEQTTLECNTPSHEQCVFAHIERNGSRTLASLLKEEEGVQVIDKIDYLDPFDRIKL